MLMGSSEAQFYYKHKSNPIWCKDATVNDESYKNKVATWKFLAVFQFVCLIIAWVIVCQEVYRHNSVCNFPKQVQDPQR